MALGEQAGERGHETARLAGAEAGLRRFRESDVEGVFQGGKAVDHVIPAERSLGSGSRVQRVGHLVERAFQKLAEMMDRLVPVPVRSQEQAHDEDG